MQAPAALLLTDLVDSAALAQRLGDRAMGAVWAAHDRLARDLLRAWRGREIDKTDGFLLLFDRASDALGYALQYHRVLTDLERDLQPLHPGVCLRARAGLHVGAVSLRETPLADVALGAKPLEVDGISKPLAARVMGAAVGRQTLLTQAALDALGPTPHRCMSHGHWRIKGLPEPLELHEIGEADAPFVPPPDGEKVYRVVQQGDLWLPLRDMRHGLPAERDAFVGRGAMLQDLGQRFDGDTRLVSVLGVGGCGKTRLAMRFGWVALGDFPGGVWFCDLAPARDVEGLVGAVAQGLDVPLGKDDPVVQLGHAIAGRGECLIILDNFEHLARHAEATLGQWLGRAPKSRFLVTTREVLGIAGEETIALPPLQASDAERLFMRRAASAKRDFDPDADDQAAVAKLVALLDGLPLAIELAAARVRTLSPRALLARMSERFKLLTSSGGRMDRQSTLRTAFDWSWELMSTAEKTAQAQLSVFEGGFTLDAAEAVLDLQHLSDPPWTMDVVISLADKSFVRPLAGDRFDLLGSVQAYAAEHLQTEGRYPGSGVAAQLAARGRHAHWYAELGPERAVAARCADLDNLVVACRRSIVAGQSELAAAALYGAWGALSLRGPFSIGVELAQAVLAMGQLSALASARAQTVLAHALECGGQRAQAAVHYGLAVQHAQQSSDKSCLATALVRLGCVLGPAGKPELDRALALSIEAGDAVLECSALNGLGTLDFEQGRMAQAQVQYEAALALARRIGHRRWEGSLLGNLGNLYASQGAMDAARVHMEGTLEIARALGDRHRLGNGLSNLGMLAFLQGRLDDAAEASEAAHAVACEIGHTILLGTVLCNLGLIYGAAGRHAEALARLESAVEVSRLRDNARSTGQALGHLGLAQARLGHFDAARSALAEGHTLLQQSDDLISLGLLLCSRSESEWLAGDVRAAAAARAEVHALCIATASGPDSELGLALARQEQLQTAANAA
jgi:predicted ATPase/class 3 adenylate cyclase